MTKDLLIYESGNGGELAVINNDLALGDQLLQQAYLAMFGGNVEADTLGNEPANEPRFDWWGNSLLFGQNSAKQFNSQTERALMNNALNSTGRVNIQRAAENDLQYLKASADVKVNVAILSTDKVRIDVSLGPTRSTGEAVLLSLIWDSAKGEVVIQKVI